MDNSVILKRAISLKMPFKTVLPNLTYMKLRKHLVKKTLSVHSLDNLINIQISFFV